MNRSGVGVSPETIPEPLASTLAPLDRKRFGIALGALFALALFLLTATDLLRSPEHGLNLTLLSQYFPGYELSWAGALAGTLWAFGVGFCAGWFLALVRNFSVSAWLFLVRSRHEITATRDFLDRI